MFWTLSLRYMQWYGLQESCIMQNNQPPIIKLKMRKYLSKEEELYCILGTRLTFATVAVEKSHPKLRQQKISGSSDFFKKLVWEWLVTKRIPTASALLFKSSIIMRLGPRKASVSFIRNYKDFYHSQACWRIWVWGCLCFYSTLIEQLHSNQFHIVIKITTKLLFIEVIMKRTQSSIVSMNQPRLWSQKLSGKRDTTYI